MHRSSSAGRRGWASRAACRGTPNPGLFFPAATGITAAGQAREAKAVCADCPVLTACLAYALATRQEYGVWGGTTERERRAMARARSGQASLRARRAGPPEPAR